jgi:hypothetical protein
VKHPFNRQSILRERIFAPHHLASSRQDDSPMTLTTGAILRRITEADLSAASRKLSTIILDGIAWKDGYNGLARGTAAFTLAHLAEKMRMSRQRRTALLAELAASTLELVRWKPNGKFAPWLFRFGKGEEDAVKQDVVSATGDTSLSRCLIPRFDGVILSQEWKEALWDKFVTGAPRPRTPSEQQYSDRKLRSRS